MNELPDGANQVVEHERLGDDGVGPGGGGSADLRGAGEERDPGGGSAGADLLDERAAVLRADVHVEQDSVDVVLAQVAPGLVEGVGLEHAVALELEVHLAEKPDRRLVVDDEYRVADPHWLG